MSAPVVIERDAVYNRHNILRLGSDGMYHRVGEMVTATDAALAANALAAYYDQTGGDE